MNAFEPEKREEECTYKPEEAVTVHAFYTCVNHDLHTFIHMSIQSSILSSVHVKHGFQGSRMMPRNG